MSSQAKLGKGTLLYIGDAGSPENFHAIPEVLEISGPPEGKPDLIDVTNHDTPDLNREQITGLISQNEITVRCNYIKDTYQTVLRNYLNTGEKYYFQIVIPSVGGDETVIFLGRVSGWKVLTPINSQQELQFSLAPTGAAIWT